MSAGVVRCEVGLLREGCRLRPLDEHVGVLMTQGVPQRWLHAADVVGIPEGDDRSAAEVLDLLPGCRVVVDLRAGPAVHVRGALGAVRLFDRATAGLVAALACSWPVEWGGTDAVAAAVRDAELSEVSCTAAGPVASVSARLRGRTAVCRWEALS